MRNRTAFRPALIRPEVNPRAPTAIERGARTRPAATQTDIIKTGRCLNARGKVQRVRRGHLPPFHPLDLQSRGCLGPIASLRRYRHHRQTRPKHPATPRNNRPLHGGRRRVGRTGVSSAASASRVSALFGQRTSVANYQRRHPQGSGAAPVQPSGNFRATNRCRRFIIGRALIFASVAVHDQDMHPGGRGRASMTGPACAAQSSVCVIRASQGLRDAGEALFDNSCVNASTSQKLFRLTAVCQGRGEVVKVDSPASVPCPHDVEHIAPRRVEPWHRGLVPRRGGWRVTHLDSTSMSRLFRAFKIHAHRCLLVFSRAPVATDEDPAADLRNTSAVRLLPGHPRHRDPAKHVPRLPVSPSAFRHRHMPHFSNPRTRPCGPAIA